MTPRGAARGNWRTAGFRLNLQMVSRDDLMPGFLRTSGSCRLETGAPGPRGLPGPAPCEAHRGEGLVESWIAFDKELISSLSATKPFHCMTKNMRMTNRIGPDLLVRS
jgi:hypothetical protein